MNNNQLFSSKECPYCHTLLIIGYNSDNLIKCPKCENIIDININNSIFDTNNKSNYYPYLMSDSRFLTNYISAKELTDYLKKLNGIKNYNKFRLFLQNNAKQLNFLEKQNLNNQTKISKIYCSEGWDKI